VIVVAVLAAMVTVWLLVPAQGPGLKRLAERSRGTPDVNLWRVIIGADVVAAVAGLFVKPLGILAAAAMVCTTLTWIVMTRVNDKRSMHMTREVVRTAQVLESLLALGHIPTSAMNLAAEECPVLAPVVAELRMGGDPWDVLDELSRRPGQTGLAEIGQAWRVAQVSGASMHESLERVRQNLEEGAETALIVSGELAGPRATGQLLGLLPLVGLGIAFGLGSNPLVFLTDGMVGRACLLIGLGLACCGLVWSEFLGRTGPGGARGRKKTSWT